MNEIHSKGFISIVFIIVILVLATIAALNWIIDPFDVFQNHSLEKINQIKISLEKQQRLHKALEIARRKPKGIILGSSRPMVGVDPSDLHEKGYFNVYNAAFSGASIEEIAHYFDHALYYQPQLKLVIIGIDLFAFGKNRTPQNDFSLNFLKEGILSYERQVSFLFSKNALRSSFETWRQNADSQAVNVFLKHGQYNPDCMPHMLPSEVIERDFAYLKAIHSARREYCQFELDLVKIARFEQMIQRCKKEGIETKIFICPAKAIYWEALYQKHLWKDLETLKRKLCQIHPLWDFSGFNRITLEKNHDQEHCFYYECSHFTPYVGKIVIETLFNEPPTDHPEFGYYLTPQSVECALEAILKERQDWLMQPETQFDAALKRLHEL